MKLTDWNNGDVVEVLAGRRKVVGFEHGESREPYFVNEQGMTGGPVIRGPWGTIGGMQRDWNRYSEECKRLNYAFMHGVLAARRFDCEREKTCPEIIDGSCPWCGGRA